MLPRPFTAWKSTLSVYGMEDFRDLTLSWHGLYGGDKWLDHHVIVKVLVVSWVLIHEFFTVLMGEY